jgi:dihydrodipicolinate synthase/N-acetylneuraminate lyase
LVLYHPPHAKQALLPQDYQRLSRAVPRLIGIKVADGDARWYAEMRQYAADLAVFVPGHHLATGMKEGVGTGAYSNVACLSPRGAQHWYRLMQQDIAEALGIEHQIEAFFSRYLMPLQRAGYSNPALDKVLAAVGGWASIGTRLRWPYRGVPEEVVPDIRRAAQRCLPSFFFDHLK